MDRTCRVQLAGGPRDGWVYDVALHWELTRMGQDVEWVPPKEIEITGWPEATFIGSYIRTGLEENGNLIYDWHPPVSQPGTEPPLT